jgi:amino acid efflux transporter
VHGAALYVGALIGPGLLLVPALAVQEAGAASIIAWAGLIVLSAPLAITFAALGVRHPVAGGVSAYVREGLGDNAAAVTGAWFLTAVMIGTPAVSLIGGYYVADLTGSGTAVAVLVGLAMFATVAAANLFGLRISAGFQLGLSSVLIVVMAVAISFALPSHAGDNWTPFAPHGWWAVGTAANVLIWLVIGWEAVAQLAGEFKNPVSDLPRSIALAFGIVTVLYGALAVATIGVTAGTTSKVPLADLVSVGFGRAGRDATAVLAVALTMGTMNVYMGGASKLASSLAAEGALPRWLGGDAHLSVPRRPLVVLAVAEVVVLIPLVAGIGSPSDLVRATSGCFIGVYLLALGSAFRILTGRVRLVAAVAIATMVVLGVFAAWYLLVPIVAALAALALKSSLRTTESSLGSKRGPTPVLRHGDSSDRSAAGR